MHKQIGIMELVSASSALPTFETWLSITGNLSPAAFICPSILQGRVVGPTDHPPQGMVPVIRLTKAFTLYLTPEAKREFKASVRLYGKTIGKIAKYVGSYVVAKRVRYMTVANGLKVMIMPGNWPGLMDGLWYYPKSFGLTGRHSAVARFGFNFRPSNETEQERLDRETLEEQFPTAGLVKGRGVPMPDHFFPAGVMIITSEIKKELQWPGLTNQALFWQPGPPMKVKDESVISLQSILHVLSFVAATSDFANLVAEYFAYGKANPEKVLAIMQEEGEDEEIEENESRDAALGELLRQAQITPWVAPASGNAILGRINKGIRAKDMSLYPCTAQGCDVMAAYVSMLPFAMFEDAIRKCTPGDRNIPKSLSRAAATQYGLEACTSEGHPILYATKRVYDLIARGATGDIRAFIYRNPVGSGSGTKVIIRQLPEDLEKILGEGVYTVPTAEVFKKVWTANEGGDLDDCFWILIGRLADLAWRGWDLREAYKSEDPEGRAKFVAGVMTAADLLPSIPLTEINTVPKAEQILSQWFDVSVTEPEAYSPGDLRKRTITSLLPKAQPAEIKLPPKASEAEITDLQDYVHDAVFMQEENPFDAAVGIAANAQMFGMALAIGWVRIPGASQVDIDHAARGLMQAMLSDIVDASVKGEGYEAAWKSLREIQAISVWVDVMALTGEVAIYAPVTKRVPLGIRARTQESVDLIATDEVCPLDGKPVWLEVLDENGYRVTAALNDQMGYYSHWDKKKRRRVYVGAFESWADWAAFVEAWTKAKVTEAPIAEGLTWIRSVVGSYVGSAAPRDVAARRYANDVTQNHLLPATDLVKERRKLAERWGIGNSRDWSERKALSAWVNYPTRQAWANVQATILEKFPAMTQESYDRLLLAIVLNYLSRAEAVKVIKTKGQLRLKGGLPTVALFTDGIHEGKVVPGPWRPFANALAKAIKAAKSKANAHLVIKIKWAPDLKICPADYVGKSIEEILRMPGHTVSEGTVAGEPEQSEEAKPLAMVLSANLLRDRATRKLVHRDKTAWEIAEIKGATDLIGATFPGTVTTAELHSVTCESKVVKKRTPEMGTTYEQQFLVLFL